MNSLPLRGTASASPETDTPSITQFGSQASVTCLTSLAERRLLVRLVPWSIKTPPGSESSALQEGPDEARWLCEG
jgi:hypothetical protein